MKCIPIVILLLIAPLLLGAQQIGLPRYLTDQERLVLDNLGYQHPQHPVNATGFNTTPPDAPIRSMAEWEELQAIVVTWTQYRSVLAEIIEAAQEECRVIVVSTNPGVAQAQLQNTYGVTPNSNVEFIAAPYNSIWVRDYGPNTAYLNDVDSLVLVDWIYNRNRPADDIMSAEIAEHLDIPLFSMTEAPFDLVNTGGNYMSDGMGTGFSSNLVLDENLAGNPWNASPKDQAGVAEAMDAFLGIDPYILMEKLPYDGIHHIDMHMKLLDEQTLLVGKFPDNISDGPQIEANIQYVISQYESAWGKPFKVVRIPQPPCGNGEYPPFCSNPYEYRTYVNALIVNRSILVPVYGTSLDEEALAIWQENMPGYTIVGINSSTIINAGGAVHCITKEIGAPSPLRIATARIDTACDQQAVPLEAIVQHSSGISEVTLHYSTDPANGYATLPLLQQTDSLYQAQLPALPAGQQVYYYLSATANSGKTANRPMTAPEGHWTYQVGECAVTATNNRWFEPVLQLHDIFPNPAHTITAIPVSTDRPVSILLEVTDMLGNQMAVLHDGILSSGKKHFFIDASRLASGVYAVTLHSPIGTITKKLVVR